MASNPPTDTELPGQGTPLETTPTPSSATDGSSGTDTPPSAPLEGGQPDLAAPPPPPPPRADWRDRRIGEQQARIRDLRAQLEQANARVAGPQNPVSGQPHQAPYGQMPPDRAAIDREIEQRATLMASQQEFTRRCNDVADQGRQQYNDFDVRIQKLIGLVDGSDPQQIANYNGFLSAAMETGDAPRLLHHLGGDLNEASRILSLTPIKMAVELTRMSGAASSGGTNVTMPNGQVVSTVPRPINPVGSATSITGNRSIVAPDDATSDNLSTSEWMARREQQIAERRQQRR
jgi:hypothetical protein